MSQENVELVRSMYRPGDPSRFFELPYDEVEAVFDASAAPLLPDYPQRIRGKDAVVDFYRHNQVLRVQFFTTREDALEAAGCRTDENRVTIEEGSAR